VVAWTVTFFIAYFTACGTRIAARFLAIGHLGKDCIDNFALSVAMTVIDVLVDLAMLIIPIPLV
jgi:hypothetical protein